MITIDRRLRQLGRTHGERPAIITAAPDGACEELSWAGLSDRVLALAGRMRAAAGPDTVVAIPAHRSLDGVSQVLAVLCAGLIALPYEPSVPPAELERQFSAVGDRLATPTPAPDLLGRASGPAADRPPAAAEGGYVLLTGGSTGLPKPVLRPGLPFFHPDKGPSLLLQTAGWRPGQTQLVVGSLAHAAPFNHLLEGVLSGNTLVLPELFLPGVILDLVERHRVDWIQLTPTHMRMLEPALAGRPDALRRVSGVLHTAAPCPPGTKRAWIEAVGPQRLFEMYAATEDIGQTLCRGDEWLAHPGTVGRGFLTRIRIHDDDGRLLPPGEVGTVHMRGLPGSRSGRGTIRPGRPGRGGFATVGDHGHLDEDGYLYLSGRADDLAIVGGENVYTEHVAAVIMSHPGVADAAVVAAPDDVLGARLIALVVPGGQEPPGASAVLRHCRDRLAGHQLPAEVRMVEDLGRLPSGKLPREKLRRIVAQPV
ncbi:bile acid-coenzyme A ligase [Nonomuraea thailandensis]|uniref:Long-chain-fatty-acid--CoA ligase n=1 Tax=Nonomuraea thailandensis TaxID=1188745 RepID=A0A9X2GJH9_9ACTN|nr:AMP-binding protein [Nonomuraea thailandensis]MCP2356566.1 bile acid-coenzyme A ligase [Nonomuraea thailandensis]